MLGDQCVQALLQAVLLLLQITIQCQACTTLAAARSATSTGAVFCAHSNDGDGNTVGNLLKVAPQTWSTGSLRKVSGGSIAQVAQTNGYFTKAGGYASTNEFQVGLAESTCVSVFAANSSAGAILNIVDLSELGLERAVLVMGDLATTHGYNDAGESLLVVDTEEGYIFHVPSDSILPDPTQSSAVWAAQRIPDDHVAVVANSFTIRTINFTDQKNFLYSANIHAAAQQTGRYHGHSPGDPLDFTRVFAGPEPGRKYYSGRRMWEGYRHLAAPEAHAALPTTYTEYVSRAPYPATLQASPRSVNVSTMMYTMRSYYQDTPWDLSRQRMASGPAFTPDRWLTGGNDSTVDGAWERPISVSRTIVSYVVECRHWLPREIGGTLWYSNHAAHTSLHIPFPVGMVGTSVGIPGGFANNSLQRMDRGVGFFQASKTVYNIAQLRFSDMIGAIRTAQNKVDAEGKALQKVVDDTYTAHTTTMHDVAVAYNAHAVASVHAWWDLSDTLLLQFGDSYKGGYPTWFLSDPEVGYLDGPPPSPPVPPMDPRRRRL